MKIHGVAIASHIHFIARFVITYGLIINDEDAQKCMIPLNHPDSFKGLPEMIQVGYFSFINRVFAWWSFDVYTQLAAMLSDTDIAA
jgi:Na+-driven multidrug efflux pump